MDDRSYVREALNKTLHRMKRMGDTHRVGVPVQMLAIETLCGKTLYGALRQDEGETFDQIGARFASESGKFCRECGERSIAT